MFSGTLPEHLNDVDVYVNKGEPTTTFIGVVHNVVQGLREQKSAVVKDIPKWLSLGDKVLGDEKKAA